MTKRGFRDVLILIGAILIGILASSYIIDNEPRFAIFKPPVGSFYPSTYGQQVPDECSPETVNEDCGAFHVCLYVQEPITETWHYDCVPCEDVNSECGLPGDTCFQCNNQCVFTLWDNNNCGPIVQFACGNVCPEGTMCIFGTCRSDCPASINEGNKKECAQVCSPIPFSSACIDKCSDPNNCGACGNVCPDSVCINEVCQCDLYNPDLCGETCVDLNEDEANCGSCGTQCPFPGQTYCGGGECACISSPNAEICPDGCKLTQSDEENCGSCGNQCAPGQQCINGVCCGSGSICYNQYSQAQDCCQEGEICHQENGQCCSAECQNQGDPECSQVLCLPCYVAKWGAIPGFPSGCSCQPCDSTQKATD